MNDYTKQIDDMCLTLDDYVHLCREIQEQINDVESFNGLNTYADTDEFIASLNKAERLDLLKQLQDRLIDWLKENYKKSRRKK